MINKKIKNICMGIGIVLFVFIGSCTIYSYTRPFNIYQRAVTKTMKENKTHIKNELISSGEIDELKSQQIEYSIDKKNQFVEIKGDSIGEDCTEMLISKDKLYLKYGDDYVNIMDSDYINSLTNKLTSSLNLDGDNIYDDYQQELINSIDKKNITKERVIQNINNKDMPLTMLTLTIDKDKAKDLIHSYIEKNFSKNMDQLVDETIAAQVSLTKASNITYTSDDIKTLKNIMLDNLKKSLQEKLNTIEYSDMKMLIGVDSIGYIRYREEEYELSIDNKKNSIKNTTEYLDFGKNVNLTNLDSVKVLSVEEFLANKKETQKEELKNFALKNPNKEISIENATQDKMENNSDEENSESPENKSEN